MLQPSFSPHVCLEIICVDLISFVKKTSQQFTGKLKKRGGRKGSGLLGLQLVRMGSLPGLLQDWAWVCGARSCAGAGLGHAWTGHPSVSENGHLSPLVVLAPRKPWASGACGVMLQPGDACPWLADPLLLLSSPGGDTGRSLIQVLTILSRYPLFHTVH